MSLVEPERIREFFKDLERLMKEQDGLCICSTYDWTGEDLTQEHHPECPDRYYAGEVIMDHERMVWNGRVMSSANKVNNPDYVSLYNTGAMLQPKGIVTLSCGTHGIYSTQVVNSNWCQFEPCPQCPPPSDNEISFTLKA